MSALQKFAWFNLAVIALTLLVVLALLPFLGKGAMGGLGCLGFLGLGYFLLRPKPGRVLTDERDHLIQQRSMTLAYTVFWLLFVLVAVLLSPMLYGQDGTVPVSVVQMSVFWAFMVVQAVMSIAILVQSAGGTRDAG
jgi:predicted membrane protein DUF2178